MSSRQSLRSDRPSTFSLNLCKVLIIGIHSVYFGAEQVGVLGRHRLEFGALGSGIDKRFSCGLGFGVQAPEWRTKSRRTSNMHGNWPYTRACRV